MSMPPPPTNPAPGALPPKKTNWWAIGCGGCLGLIVIGVLIAVGIYFIAMKAVKSSDAYALALKNTQESSLVQEKLGTPITAGSMATGAVQVTNGSGTATIVFSVSGPKGGGAVVFNGNKEPGGEWKPAQHIVTITGTNEQIDLVKNPPGSAPPLKE